MTKYLQKQLEQQKQLLFLDIPSSKNQNKLLTSFRLNNNLSTSNLSNNDNNLNHNNNNNTMNLTDIQNNKIQDDSSSSIGNYSNYVIYDNDIDTIDNIEIDIDGDDVDEMHIGALPTPAKTSAPIVAVNSINCIFYT